MLDICWLLFWLNTVKPEVKAAFEKRSPYGERSRNQQWLRRTNHPPNRGHFLTFYWLTFVHRFDCSLLFTRHGVLWVLYTWTWVRAKFEPNIGIQTPFNITSGCQQCNRYILLNITENYLMKLKFLGLRVSFQISHFGTYKYAFPCDTSQPIEIEDICGRQVMCI